MKKLIIITLIILPILSYGKNENIDNLVNDDLQELIQKLIAAQRKIPTNTGFFETKDNSAVKREIESIITSLKNYDSSNSRTISRFENQLKESSNRIVVLSQQTDELNQQKELLTAERQELEKKILIRQKRIVELQNKLEDFQITDKTIDPNKLERRAPLITLKIPKEGTNKFIGEVSEMFTELSYQKSFEVSRDNIMVYKFSKKIDSRKTKEILFWIEKDYEYPKEKIKLFFEVGLFRKLDGEFKRMYLKEYKKELPQNIVNLIMQKFNQP